MVSYRGKEVVVKHVIDNANVIVCVRNNTWTYFVIENGRRSPELPFGKPENGDFPTPKEVTRAFVSYMRLSTLKGEKK